MTNCHKLPAYNFDRRLVSVDEIAQALQHSLTSVLRANPDARVLLTVSPVRHWRDGPVENARSKAHLLAGAHAAIELLRAAGVGEGVGEGGAGHVSYFPSFEIVNDDLRDYRFFESDMVHPNSVAVEYIWDKLVGAMFSDEAIRTMHQVRIGRLRAHVFGCICHRRSARPLLACHNGLLSMLFPLLLYAMLVVPSPLCVAAADDKAHEVRAVVQVELC